MPVLRLYLPDLYRYIMSTTRLSVTKTRRSQKPKKNNS